MDNKSFIIYLLQPYVTSRLLNIAIRTLAAAKHLSIRETEYYVMNRIEGLSISTMRSWKGNRPPRSIVYGDIFLSLVWLILTDGYLRLGNESLATEWLIDILNTTDVGRGKQFTSNNLQEFDSIFTNYVRLDGKPLSEDQYIEVIVRLRSKSLDSEHKHLIDLRQNDIFGPPHDDLQYICDIFVIMPFADKFEPIYTDHIKKISEVYNYTVKRGDNFFSKRSIMADVWSAMVSSRLVIADCTGRNANVFYELGMAHTLNKPVITIVQDLKDIPFDIRHMRVIEYKHSYSGMLQLEIDLGDAFETMMPEEGD